MSQISDETLKAARDAFNAEHNRVVGRRFSESFNEGLRAALAAAAPTWQPIETAPRDGTVVLGYEPRLGLELVFWGCQPQHNPHSFWISASCRINHIDQPTHWQPLPAPPSTSNEPKASGSP